MSVERDGHPMMESVLRHHADEYPTDTDELLYEASSDGIIVDVEVVDHGYETGIRYWLAGSLEAFEVYAERLPR